MKRKITGLFFTVLLCAAAFNGFCQEFIPLTWEMASSLRAQDKLKLLNYYFNKSFSIKINEKNNAKQYDATNEGKLVIDGANLSPNIKKFTIGDKGKLQSDLETILEIIYPVKDNENIVFRFVRNSVKNRFELVSAMIDTNNYIFRSSDELPYLTIEPDKPIPIPNTELQAIPFSEVRNYPSQSRQGSTASSSGGNNNQVPVGNRYGPVYISDQDSFGNNTYQPQETKAPLPLINNFQAGKYYIQIGAYTNVNTVYSEIAKINYNFPVAVMKANVIIKGKNTLVHRILIGPLNRNESRHLLRQIKASYCDAFIWSGK